MVPAVNQNTSIEINNQVRSNNPLLDENVKQLARKVLDDLNCPVTLDMMANPKTLKCGHSLEAASLDSLCATARNQRREPRCTVCRVGIQGELPSPNITIKSLIDKIPRLFALLGLDENLPAPALNQAQSREPVAQPAIPAREPSEAQLQEADRAGYLRGHQEGFAKGVVDSRRSIQDATRLAIDNASRSGEIRGFARGLEEGQEIERQRALAQAKANPSLFQRITNYISKILSSFYKFWTSLFNSLFS